MNLQNVAQREILNFDQFLGKVHDEKYKALAPSNQSQGGLNKSGLSKIKREPAYDHIGYADAYFNNTSNINVPGVRIDKREGAIMRDSTSFGTASIMHATESLHIPFDLKRLDDF